MGSWIFGILYPAPEKQRGLSVLSVFSPCTFPLCILCLYIHISGTTGDFSKAVNLYSWGKKIYKKGAYVDVWMALWTKQTSCKQEEMFPWVTGVHVFPPAPKPLSSQADGCRAPRGQLPRWQSPARPRIIWRSNSSVYLWFIPSRRCPTAWPGHHVFVVCP